MTSEAPKEMTTTHLPPDEIDKLRFKAFATNDKDDILSYYKAASLYFQERHERSINRQAHAQAMVAAEVRGLAYRLDVSAVNTQDEVYEDHLRDLASAIRARTPADAQASLDALLKAERVKALREAADCIGHITQAEDKDAILAIIEKETGQ